MSSLRAWIQSKLATKFYKAESFLTNAFAVVVGILPDLINVLISQWSMVDALPTLTPEHKLMLFGACHVLAMILRARKQANMPPATIPVATIHVPATVDVGLGAGRSVPVQTEVRIGDGERKASAVYELAVPTAEASEVRSYSFEEFVAYGHAHAESLVDDVPWSFTFYGHAVTHENDDCYLIFNGGVSPMRFERGDTLWAGPGERLQIGKPKAAAYL